MMSVQVQLAEEAGQSNILHREIGVVFEVGVPALRVPESIDDSRRDDGVLHSLIDFIFQVLGKVQIIPDCRRGIN